MLRDMACLGSGLLCIAAASLLWDLPENSEWPMDQLENELHTKYGGALIPSGETRDILRDAADRGVIDARDVISLQSVSVQDMIEYILKVRRDFLCRDRPIDFGSEEAYSGMCSSESTKKDPRIVDNVLRAYFEYEKITRVTAEKRGGVLKWVVALGIAVALYFAYTPRPY